MKEIDKLGRVVERCDGCAAVFGENYPGSYFQVYRFDCSSICTWCYYNHDVEASKRYDDERMTDPYNRRY